MSTLSAAQKAQYANQFFNAVAVTPSDSADLPGGAARLFIGGAGNLKVTLAGMDDGTSVIFNGLTAGSFPPIVVKRVWSGSTTATNILALS